MASPETAPIPNPDATSKEVVHYEHSSADPEFGKSAGPFDVLGDPGGYEDKQAVKAVESPTADRVEAQSIAVKSMLSPNVESAPTEPDQQILAQFKQSLASELSHLKDPQEIADFVQRYVEREGIDPATIQTHGVEMMVPGSTTETKDIDQTHFKPEGPLQSAVLDAVLERQQQVAFGVEPAPAPSVEAEVVDAEVVPEIATPEAPLTPEQARAVVGHFPEIGRLFGGDPAGREAAYAEIRQAVEVLKAAGDTEYQQLAERLLEIKDRIDGNTAAEAPPAPEAAPKPTSAPELKPGADDADSAAPAAPGGAGVPPPGGDAGENPFRLHLSPDLEAAREKVAVARNNRRSRLFQIRGEKEALAAEQVAYEGELRKAAASVIEQLESEGRQAEITTAVAFLLVQEKQARADVELRLFEDAREKAGSPKGLIKKFVRAYRTNRKMRMAVTAGLAAVAVGSAAVGFVPGVAAAGAAKAALRGLSGYTGTRAAQEAAGASWSRRRKLGEGELSALSEEDLDAMSGDERLEKLTAHESTHSQSLKVEHQEADRLQRDELLKREGQRLAERIESMDSGERESTLKKVNQFIMTAVHEHNNVELARIKTDRKRANLRRAVAASVAAVAVATPFVSSAVHEAVSGTQPVGHGSASGIGHNGPSVVESHPQPPTAEIAQPHLGTARYVAEPGGSYWGGSEHAVNHAFNTMGEGSKFFKDMTPAQFEQLKELSDEQRRKVKLIATDYIKDRLLEDHGGNDAVEIGQHINVSPERTQAALKYALRQVK